MRTTWFVTTECVATVPRVPQNCSRSRDTTRQKHSPHLLSAEHPAEQRPEPDIWLSASLMLFQGGLQKAWSGAWHPRGPGREPLTPTPGRSMWEEGALDHTGPGQQLPSEPLPHECPFSIRGKDSSSHVLWCDFSSIFLKSYL